MSSAKFVKEGGVSFSTDRDVCRKSNEEKRGKSAFDEVTNTIWGHAGPN